MPPAALRRLVVDIEPLKESREFRLLYGGQVVSFIGAQMTAVAAPIQLYGLTHSTLAVGMLGLAQLGPLLLCSLLGGTIADALDRRKVLLVTTVLLALCSAGLAVNATAGHHVWALFVLSSVIAGLSGIDSPTRSASVAKLVRPERFTAAAALQQSLMTTGFIVGPAIAGLLIANVSFAATYWVDVSTFAVAFAAILAMRPLVPEGGGTRIGFASLGEGLRFLRGRQALQGTFVIDINAMVFGMPRAVFPAMAATRFGGGAETAGLLYTSVGVGGLIGALSSGWAPHVKRQGRAVLLAVAAWGTAIALFGVVRWLWLAMVLLALAGASDVVSALFRNTIMQLSVPDRLRGRLNAVHIAVVTGGPRLGDAETGAVAALAGTQTAVISGGLACIAGVAVIGRLMPGLARWTRAELDDDPELRSGAAAAPSTS